MATTDKPRIRYAPRWPDPPGVKEKGERLMAQAADKVDQTWLEQAYQAIKRVADLGEPFSVNEVWELTGLEVPPSPGARALGSQVSRLAREGYIRPVAFVRSKKGVAHVQVWVRN